MKYIIIIILILAGGAFLYYKGPDLPKPVVSETQTPLSPIEAGELTLEYKHPVHNFSFRHPVDFTVTSIPSEGRESIVVQNTKGQGFQLLITPIDEDVSVLTTEMIRRDIPDLEIKNPQDILIGESGKGVAFLSDNEIFGGNSREIWFAYRRALYQFSTYAEYDDFLKSIFATWKFE